LTGLAGLLSGALSMGAGEYISVRSQRELLDASTPRADASSVRPQLDVYTNELALVYRARGMSPEQARERAAAVLANPQPTAQPAPENNQHEVVGTGMPAAVSSFLFFACGAAMPVLPFAVGLTGVTAVVAAAVIVGAALLLTGV